MSFGGNFVAVPICGVVQYRGIHVHDPPTFGGDKTITNGFPLLRNYAKSCYNALCYICKDFLFRSR